MLEIRFYLSNLKTYETVVYLRFVNQQNGLPANKRYKKNLKATILDKEIEENISIKGNGNTNSYKPVFSVSHQ